MPLAAKFCVIVAVVLLFHAIGMLASIAIQLAKGFTAIEPALYGKALLLDSVPFVLMGGMGLVLQVLQSGRRTVLMSPQSFIKHPVRWLRAISKHRAYAT